VSVRMMVYHNTVRASVRFEFVRREATEGGRRLGDKGLKAEVTRGEGACSRWAAEQPHLHLEFSADLATTASPSGSKLPRHEALFL